MDFVSVTGTGALSCTNSGTLPTITLTVNAAQNTGFQNLAGTGTLLKTAQLICRGVRP